MSSFFHGGGGEFGERGGKDGKKVGGLGLKYTSFITNSCQ
jgi:hypothetical protein